MDISLKVKHISLKKIKIKDVPGTYGNVAW